MTDYLICCMLFLQNSLAEEENNNVAESSAPSLGEEAGESDAVAISTVTESLSWSAMLSESEAEELPIQIQTKSDLGTAVGGQQSDDAKKTPEKGIEVSEDKSCEFKVRSTTTMTSVATQSGGQLCCGVQRPSKNGVGAAASDKNNAAGSRNNHKDKVVAATINEDLDVAMQKLESMRINGGDKTTPKRKSTTKRQSLNTKDAAATSADEKTNIGGAKSPTPAMANGSTSPLPPHSSKAKKRKSRRKTTKLTNGNNSDENTTCKALTDEGSDGDARNSCDSIKNYDVCVDRTADKNNAKCAYSSSRARVPENERMYINSHDDDSLR